MSQAKKRTAAVAGFCFFFAVILLVTALTVYNIAGDKDTLATQMRRHSVPEYSGLPDSEYPEMGKMIAVYLTGGGKTFQYSYTDAEGNTVEIDASGNILGSCQHLQAILVVGDFDPERMEEKCCWMRFVRGLPFRWRMVPAPAAAGF